MTDAALGTHPATVLRPSFRVPAIMQVQPSGTYPRKLVSEVYNLPHGPPVTIPAGTGKHPS